MDWAVPATLLTGCVILDKLFGLSLPHLYENNNNSTNRTCCDLLHANHLEWGPACTKHYIDISCDYLSHAGSSWQGGLEGK